jgi:AbrB family looped-hinge helix DNA binding protein
METSVVTANGMTTVPVRIRRKFRIKKGTKVAFIEQDGKLVLQPLDKDYFMKMAGILGTKGELLRALMEERKSERQPEDAHVQ